MSDLNYLKLDSTFSNICNTIQLDNATKCHYAFKNFWGEPCSNVIKTRSRSIKASRHEIQLVRRSCQVKLVAVR